MSYPFGRLHGNILKIDVSGIISVAYDKTATICGLNGVFFFFFFFYINNNAITFFYPFVSSFIRSVQFIVRIYTVRPKCYNLLRGRMPRKPGHVFQLLFCARIHLYIIFSFIFCPGLIHFTDENETETNFRHLGTYFFTN